MPYKRYYPKTYRRKKRYYRRKNNSYAYPTKVKKTYHKNTQNARRTKVGQPFPACLSIRNNWCESSADIAQALPGAPTSRTMLKLGSAFDPAASPGLQQESIQYHNIYRNYYAQYCVNYVKVTLSWRNTSTNDARVICGIADDQAVPPLFTNVNINEFEMQPYTQALVLEADQGSRYNRGTMTFKFNLNKWAKRMKVDPESRAALVTNDPTTYPVLWYAIQSENVAATALVKVDITATFYTEYSKRLQQAIMQGQ